MAFTSPVKLGQKLNRQLFERDDCDEKNVKVDAENVKKRSKISSVSDLHDYDSLERDGVTGKAGTLSQQKEMTFSPVDRTASGVSVSSKENLKPSVTIKKGKMSQSHAKNKLVMTYTSKRKRHCNSSKSVNTGSSNQRKRRLSSGSMHSTFSDSKSGKSNSSRNRSRACKRTKMSAEDEDSVDSESYTDESDQSDDEFVVEKILDKQFISGDPYYFIKWKGWDNASNTWEPVEHLDGCPELLNEFENQLAVKTATLTKNNYCKTANPRGPTFEENENVLEKTRKHMKNYGILNKWPRGKHPLSVEGVIFVDGNLTYIVRKKTRVYAANLDRSNTILVSADHFKKLYPKLVIEFYQSRVLWAQEEGEGTDNYELATQISQQSETEERVTKNQDLNEAKRNAYSSQSASTSIALPSTSKFLTVQKPTNFESCEMLEMSTKTDKQVISSPTVENLSNNDENVKDTGIEGMGEEVAADDIDGDVANMEDEEMEYNECVDFDNEDELETSCSISEYDDEG